MEEQKICKDCKNYDNHPYTQRCVMNTGEKCRVTGKPLQVSRDAKLFRMNPDGCGPEGKYFEPKIGVVGSVVNFIKNKLKEARDLEDKNE